MTSLDGRSVVIVSGPGGAGKGTIAEHLVARDDRLWLSRSWTTRERRPGESADAYRFVSRQAFEEAIASGGFIEWVEFFDYLQGTPLPDPPDGADVLLEIDVRGARQVREHAPNAVLVFVEAPSEKVQRVRLEGRGDSSETVRRRIEKAAEERAEARELGYVTVVNEELEAAVEAIEGLIAADRARRSPTSRWP